LPTRQKPEFYTIQSKFGMGLVEGPDEQMFKKAMKKGQEDILFIPSSINIEKQVNVIFKLQFK
jgi:hypothetical protein